MSRLFSFFIILIASNYANSQIYIQGGELNMQGCVSQFTIGLDTLYNVNPQCSIPHFYTCEKMVQSFDQTDSLHLANWILFPKKTFIGNTSVAFWSVGNGLWGSISSRLPCPLKKGRKYYLKIPILNPYVLDNNGNPTVDSLKKLNIWGNTDSCSRVEIIWQSPNLDTSWQFYSAVLVPRVTDYEYIHFRTWKGGNRNERQSLMLLIDSLSDIYPLDGGAISIAVHDTSIAKGQCMRLSAQPSISTYDTVLWYQVVDSTLLPVGIGLSPSVCPTTHSTYIVAMRDSVPDCAGIWWSYDTVRVWVDTTVGIREVPYTARLAVQLYPNPTQGQVQVELLLDRQLLKERAMLTLYDALGRAIFEKEIYNEEVLSLPKIAAGVYSVAIRVKEHSWRGKLWVEE
jgi:hypothetical protein